MTRKRRTGPPTGAGVVAVPGADNGGDGTIKDEITGTTGATGGGGGGGRAAV
jgi:hypothetical protein